MDNLLDQATNLNPNVHEVNAHGDPVREEDGSIRLKKDWKKLAVDRQGRKFNPKIHGDEMELDEQGYIKVRRRAATVPIGKYSKTAAFVAKYKENGYAYRPINDEGGRVDQFIANDWEPVVDKKGAVSMMAGQARSPNTRMVLMRKPIEWYEADQKAKHEARANNLKQHKAPKKDKDQYEASRPSPLR